MPKSACRVGLGFTDDDAFSAACPSRALRRRDIRADVMPATRYFMQAGLSPFTPPDVNLYTTTIEPCATPTYNIEACQYDAEYRQPLLCRARGRRLPHASRLLPRSPVTAQATKWAQAENEAYAAVEDKI